MKPTRKQLIQALCNEYSFLCHDDYDPDVDTSPEDYLKMLEQMSYEELVEETSTDEEYSLEDYVKTYG